MNKIYVNLRLGVYTDENPRTTAIMVMQRRHLSLLEGWSTLVIL